jgi:hypothetical protein
MKKSSCPMQSLTYMYQGGLQASLDGTLGRSIIQSCLQFRHQGRRKSKVQPNGKPFLQLSCYPGQMSIDMHLILTDSAERYASSYLQIGKIGRQLQHSSKTYPVQHDVQLPIHGSAIVTRQPLMSESRLLC